MKFLGHVYETAYEDEGDQAVSCTFIV